MEPLRVPSKPEAGAKSPDLRGSRSSAPYADIPPLIYWSMDR